MTVAQLINELEKQPKSMSVIAISINGDICPIDAIKQVSINVQKERAVVALYWDTEDNR